MFCLTKMKCFPCFKMRLGKILSELYFQSENSFFLSKSKMQCSNFSSVLSSFFVREDMYENWSYFQMDYTAFSGIYSTASFHLFLVIIIHQRTKLKAHRQQNFWCCLSYELSIFYLSQFQPESFMQKRRYIFGCKFIMESHGNLTIDIWPFFVMVSNCRRIQLLIVRHLLCGLWEASSVFLWIDNWAMGEQ